MSALQERARFFVERLPIDLIIERALFNHPRCACFANSNIKPGLRRKLQFDFCFSTAALSSAFLIWLVNCRPDQGERREESGVKTRRGAKDHPQACGLFRVKLAVASTLVMQQIVLSFRNHLRLLVILSPGSLNIYACNRLNDRSTWHYVIS